QGLDHLLDDPQIKEYRGKGRKEDDRWQDLEGKDVPEFVHVHHQALKEEPTARTCKFQYAYKELAHHFKEVLYKGYLKDPNGDQELQGQTDPHRFQLMAFLFVLNIKAIRTMAAIPRQPRHRLLIENP